MAYYQTKIQSTGAGYAVDVQGKRLTFIGNLPCKAGDTVWTDGKVIFGNMTRRGTPLLDETTAGIPVLSRSNHSGYFTKSGIFKQKQFGAEDWITNSKKIIETGEEEISGQKIIDAEIGSDGSLLTATDGFYRQNQTVTYKNHLYLLRAWFPADWYPVDPVNGNWHPSADELANDWRYSLTALFYTDEGEEITFGTNATNENSDAVFFYNGSETSRVNLKQYADLAEAAALAVQSAIMAKSMKDATTFNLVQQPDPPNNFIASSYARIVTLHLDKSGNWDAVIAASAYGYCFPYLAFDASLFFRSFPNFEDLTFSEPLAQCLRRFERMYFQLDPGPPVYLDIEQYPQSGYNFGNGEERERYVLDAIAYYIPRARFRYHVWFPMLFSAFKLLRVHNGVVTDTIFSNAFGGREISESVPGGDGTLKWDERGAYSYRFDDFVVAETEVKNKWDFPISDDFYFRADGLKIETIYRTDGQKVVDVPDAVNALLHDDYYEAYFASPLSIYKKLDTVASEIFTSITLPRIRDRFIPIPRAIYKSTAPTDPSYAYLSGWFRRNHDDLRISHCFAELRDGRYLLGIRDGKLIVFTEDGEVTEVADGLKNFRLCEMKNIKRARKTTGSA